ncbi:MAG: hypothetical protein JKY65_23870 [Planctomycetes bacterium]|nr:hypothetical protein [Planctomycetota bacterium]
MKNSIIRAGLLGLALVAVAAPAEAQEWVLLGERKVSLSAERDVIAVNSAQTFKKIRLKVVGAPIYLLDLVVHFKNGGKQDVSVRAKIPAGQVTRTINLTGPVRHITKVTMVYKTKLRGRRKALRATVKLFGLKMTTVAGPAKNKLKEKIKEKAAAKKIEWVKLGTRKVNFVADKDTIPVTITEGIFKRIKLHIADNALTLTDLKIHFANGQTHDVVVKKHFAANTWTRVIDLPGAARVIKKITVRYRSKLKLRKGRATLHVFGAKVVSGAAAKAVPKPKPAAGKWVTLGSRKVNWRVARGEILVTAAQGVFTKLRFHVTGNKIHVLKVRVVYGNGADTELAPNASIAADGTSPTFDLPGNKRIVKKVVLWYRTPGKRRARSKPRPTVTLQGKH